MKYTIKNIERFWARVDKDRSHTFYNGTRCWEWTGGVVKGGYGIIRTMYKRHTVHRMSFIIKYGEIQEGLCVLHHCDNPSCVNPEHLFLGTNQDNSDDMKQKGRQARISGESHWKSKLTDKQVCEIRKRYSPWGKGGEKSSTLAKEFGVSPSLIIYIVNNKRR